MSYRGTRVLRIHFTSADLSRIRIASGPDQLWETVLSLTLLGSADSRPVLGPWRAQARAGLRRLSRSQVQLLRHLVPPVGDFPDFLTPPQGSQGLEAGLDAVLATPRHRLRAELRVLPHTSFLTRTLADGDRDALGLLGAALHDYHQAVIAPYAPRMQALVDAERAVRARPLLDHGSEGLLADLGPTMRWNPPVLEVDYPVDRDIHLGGRGLLLLPSAFCWRVPVTLIDPGLPPVLVYPVSRNLDWWTGATAARGPRSLANILGPTRATCLSVIDDGCTTGELARRIGGSPPSASQHTTKLREAGLVTSVRQANIVVHTLTPLGRALLDVNCTS